MELNKIYTGDSKEILSALPNESINCCVTSPPYYGLRDYGVDGQIGLEETPEAYIARLVDVFREVKRVLKPDGTLWVNIGDSYWGGKGYSGSSAGIYQYERRKEGKSITPECSNFGGKGIIRPTDKKHEYIKQKDLIGIPWMLAFALRADGWHLRQDIIWYKPTPMPESVKDRCTKSHEYIFLLSKSPRYYFDSEAISEPVSESSNKYTLNPAEFCRTKSGDAYDFRPLRNKRDVWTVSTKPFKDAHFAVFPKELIIPCILAGCPENGVVLDPFFGSGTTGVVARKLNRNYIGIELNPKYVNIAEKRLYKELGCFK
jgi:DNA modification methylase